MVQVIPLQALPSQDVEVQLGNQICQINVYQKLRSVYLDLYVNDALIIGGVICQNLNRIVRDLYLGFVGDLCFIDNQGDTDPVYTGLGSRYNLLYLTPSDLPPGVG
jgi:hypothetical protein